MRKRRCYHKKRTSSHHTVTSFHGRLKSLIRPLAPHAHTVDLPLDLSATVQTSGHLLSTPKHLGDGQLSTELCRLILLNICFFCISGYFRGSGSLRNSDKFDCHPHYVPYTSALSRKTTCACKPEDPSGIGSLAGLGVLAIGFTHCAGVLANSTPETLTNGSGWLEN